MPAKKQKYLDYKIKISKQPLQKYYFAVDMEVITPASARKVKIGSHVWNHLSDDALRWVIENEKKHSSSVMLTEE
jgi:formate-dependent phosphoribosylglycinamide formyltransferase (GAR transformylase)